MNIERVFEIIDEKADEHIKMLAELASIESPTDDKAGVDEACALIVREAKKRGWTVEYHEEEKVGNAACITMNSGASGAAVVLSGHIDTVHPKGLFGYPPVKIEGDIIKGPGVADCKGGVVGAFAAMAALDKAGFRSRPIKLVLQTDEEVSSLYSEKRTVDFMARCSEGAVAFLNTEPCKGGQLTIMRKGIIRLIFDVEGKPVHSSLCFAGASAILEAAHKIIELERWKDRDGITCNCGVIEGGTVPNTVAQHCRFVADVRYSTEEQLESLLDRVRVISDTSYVEGTSCTVTEKSRRVCMPLVERNVRLSQRISEIFSSVGLPSMEFVSSRGGSDAADMSARGIPSVDSFGVRGAYIHSPLEYAYLSSISETAKMLAALAAFL